MVESTGAYGPWFEWQRSKLKSAGEVQPDSNRLAYQKECQRIFMGLSVMNHAMEDGIGIRVNTPEMGDGLILKETFKDWDVTYRDQLVLNAFLVTSNAVFKINNLLLVPGPLKPRLRASPNFTRIGHDA